MSCRPTTITIDQGLYEVLKDRASFNKRSLSSEIGFLIEVALALQTETSRETIRLISQLSLPSPAPAG